MVAQRSKVEDRIHHVLISKLEVTKKTGILEKIPGLDWKQVSLKPAGEAAKDGLRFA